MFIPLGTSNVLRRKPTANYVLIGLNVIVFVIPFVLPLIVNTFANNSERELTTAAVERGIGTLALMPNHPQLHQFVSYAFLHAGIWHIVGNMLFLFVFGNNVNDRLGHVGYVLLYLGGAIFSGFGQAFFHPEPIPVVGASGAVAAITGAYMVLFPKTHIHILFWFFIITTFEVPALYFIMFKLVLLDNVIMPKISGGGNVAYTAHLAGYFFGVMIPMSMLALKLLPHSHFDLWAVAQRWQRRREYQRVSPGGFSSSGQSSAQRKGLFSKETEIAVHPHAEEITQYRSEISSSIYASDLDGAASSYKELLKLDATQTLGQQQQLDIANKLMQTQEHSTAAQAYEIFIEKYPTYPFIEQIQLMLGLLYSRYLNNKESAFEHLTKALEKLTNTGQRQMCQEELERMGK